MGTGVLSRFGLIAAGLFAVILAQPVMRALPELDLWWMIPMVRQHLAGQPLAGTLRFVFSPAPINLGQPLLKGYLLLAGEWGWSIRTLIGIAMAIHVANACWIAGVGRLLGLSRWVSGSASIVYLTLFAHFHSYLWPTASQHVVAVFTILAVLWLYLKTEERIESGRPSGRGLLLITLAAGAVASLGRSALLAPILILTHIALVSKDPEQRLRRFDRWLPLFVLFMIYPALMLSFVGDVIINNSIAGMPGPAWAKMVGLISAGLAGLGLLRLVWRTAPAMDRLRRTSLRLLLWVGLPALFIGLCLQDRRQILFPYNAMIPWVTLTTSFLRPFQGVFLMDSTEPYHCLPAQMSLFSFGISVICGILFLSLFAAKRRELWLLPVWYTVCVIHVLHHYGSFPAQTPSRYFVYLSPVFVWVFCAVGWRLVEESGRRLGWSQRTCRFAWGTALLILCLTNLLAIRLEVFRSRLVGTYFLYDDIRVAQLIREDLENKAEKGRIQPFVVEGVVPLPLQEISGKFIPEISSSYSDFRMVAAEVMGPNQSALLQIGKPPVPGSWVYRVGGVRVLDTAGRDVEGTSGWIEDGLLHADQGDLKAAQGLFLRGLEHRPFLLRYLLRECRFSDARWLTDGRGLREWLGKIEGRYREQSPAPLAKWEHIRAVTNQELLDYAVCLYVLSYLENRQGHREQARRWISNLYYLEPDPSRLRDWLLTDGRLSSRKGMISYLEVLKNPTVFNDPFPWQKDDYGFGRFMARLLFHWDVRSRFDQAGTAL